MKPNNSLLIPTLIMFLSIFILNSGCKKSVVSQPELALPKLANTQPSAMFLAETDIGKKLPNPYTVANMQRALANLATKGDVKKVSNLITISHYYLKFMPKNEAEFALLKIDSNLVIYPFPLDVKLSANGGSSYREPGLPAGVPTYQYAAVPIGYKLPKVGFEILAHLYLPNERNLQGKVAANGLKAIGAPEVSVKDLVNEAENIVCETPIEVYRNGVVVQLLPPPGDCDIGGDGDYGGGGSGGGGSNCGAPSGEWRPSGRITMTDDVLGLIGVEGLKIRARRWFTTYVGFTDANGNYCVDGTFTRPANYWFDFERYDFKIGPQPRFIDYYVDGPKVEGQWNLELTGYNRYCATIFRAAFHYYHKDIQGLHRPPQNSFWAAKLHIAANPAPIFNSTGNMDWISWHLGELILINGLLASSEKTYSTTIHELAHAAHWDNSNLSLTLSAKTASESWATGVEWALTKMVYPDYAGVNWGNDPVYRNVVIDLIDNPYSLFNYGFIAPKDLVEGYNIVQIQNAIINNPTTWNEWKNNIINNYNNETEQHVETLFNHWLNN